MPWLLAAALTLIAFAAGLTLPDVDLHLWLSHRSALTHSILLPALLAAKRELRAVGCGLGAGTGLHLAADTFPNRMVGYATVKLPFAGSLSAVDSYLWLGLNALAALALAAVLAVRLHPPRGVLLVGAGVLVGGVGYLWRTDGGWPVLAILAALAGWSLWRWAAGRS